jgi:hypothetical protein
MSDPETHPMQLECCRRDHARVPVAVAMRAYEVYSHLYGPQKALITGSCRGGFGISELVAFLYAAGFPKSEWRARVDEAFRGLKVTRG